MSELESLLKEIEHLEFIVHDIFYERPQSKEFYRYAFRIDKEMTKKGMLLANAHHSEKLKSKFSTIDFDIIRQEIKEYKTIYQTLNNLYESFSSVFRR